MSNAVKGYSRFTMCEKWHNGFNDQEINDDRFGKLKSNAIELKDLLGTF